MSSNATSTAASAAPTTSAATNGALLKPAVWIVGLLIVVSHFVLIGHFPLVEPDEPRYAEIAREMVELGDWLTPHLNYVKYFEKPPLIYWLTAFNIEHLGSSELVLRLWPAFFSLLGIGSVAWLGNVMYGPRVGFAAAAVLAATPLYFGLGQVLILDMPLAGLMTVAFGAFWMAYVGDSRRRRWVLLFYLMMALAVLTKGPVAVVLIGAVTVVFLLLRRDFGCLRWTLSPAGIALFLLVALPWFILVSRRNPEFVDFFVVKQHIDRYLHPSEHHQSNLFFVPLVLAGMLPWSFFFLAAPARARDLLYRLCTLRVSPATLYCALWAAIIFLFFSLSGSKLATYILPVFPPLALLAGRFVDVSIAHEDRRVFRRTAILLAVIGAACLIAAVFTGLFIRHHHAGIIATRLFAGAAVLGTMSAAALYQLSLPTTRRGLASVLLTLVVGMLALQLVAISGRNAGQHYESLARTIGAQATPQDLVILYRHYTQGIAFYARRRVVMVGAWGELDFGSQQGDQSAYFWPEDQQLVDAWGSPRRAFLVINRSELEPLRAQLQPAPREIAAHGKKVVVVNFPETRGNADN